MSNDALKIGERAIVVSIVSNRVLREYLLTYGITVGSVFIKNYSPNYADLVNITISGRMLSIRKSDFAKLEWTKI